VADFPPVPLTLEGASALHQMFRFRWRAWVNLDAFHRRRVLTEATALLAPLEGGSAEGHPNQSAIYSQLGHKGDLMLVHFRDSFEELNQIEISLAKLELAEFLEPVHSYLSVVELGLYESTSKTYQTLSEKGFAPHSPEWNAGIAEVIERQKAAMAPRLYPRIPGSKYLCFYPMDRKRGESKNWYTVPMADRQRMMHEHGLIGRRYADEVRQVITGSIGMDDWEWGVDLFADDPVVFKKLIYEMRFDEVSAIYALFGAFYVGIRVKVADLGQLLSAPAGS
jgi:hydrogen peroxide-dependent heme synthase